MDVTDETTSRAPSKGNRLHRMHYVRYASYVILFDKELNLFLTRPCGSKACGSRMLWATFSAPRPPYAASAAVRRYKCRRCNCAQPRKVGCVNDEVRNNWILRVNVLWYERTRVPNSSGKVKVYFSAFRLLSACFHLRDWDRQINTEPIRGAIEQSRSRHGFIQ